MAASGHFARLDDVVAPSGSRVHQVRENMTAIEQTDEVRRVREHTFEPAECLHGIPKDRLRGSSP